MVRLLGNSGPVSLVLPSIVVSISMLLNFSPLMLVTVWMARVVDVMEVIDLPVLCVLLVLMIDKVLLCVLSMLVVQV